MGVWHLNEASGNAADSTTYGTTGTVGGTVNRGTAKVTNGYDFDGLSGQVNMGDPFDGHLDFGTSSFTFSCWVNVALTGSYQDFIYKGSRSNSVPGYVVTRRSSGAGGEGYVSAGDGVDRFSRVFTFSSNTWMYLVGMVDREAELLRAFVDGSEVSNPTDISSLGSVDNTNNLEISRSGDRVLGLVDELRIAIGTRSSEWISTEYTNQNSPTSFVSVGSQESTSGTTSYYEWVELYNNGTTAYDLTGWNLTDNDSNYFNLSGAGSIPAGGYLVCHIGQSGTNSSTNVYGPITTVGTSRSGMLNSIDDLAILNKTVVLEYVAWGYNVSTDDDFAVILGHWTDNEYIDTSSMHDNDTLGRDRNSKDYNATSDWENSTTNKADPFGINATEQTSGGRNIDPIPEFTEIRFILLSIFMLIVLIKRRKRKQ
jgi:hypothetical protein